MIVPFGLKILHTPITLPVRNKSAIIRHRKVVFNMKGFLKFVLTVSALFAAAVGVLVLADCIINKNRIRGAYLECDTEE